MTSEDLALILDSSRPQGRTPSDGEEFHASYGEKGEQFLDPRPGTWTELRHRRRLVRRPGGLLEIGHGGGSSIASSKIPGRTRRGGEIRLGQEVLPGIIQASRSPGQEGRDGIGGRPIGRGP